TLAEGCKTEPLAAQESNLPATQGKGKAMNQVKEPLGSQALRRAHEDAHHLMMEYHSWLETLEEPQVKELIENLLTEMEGRLSAIEEFFAGHAEYSKFPELEFAPKEPLEPPPDPTTELRDKYGHDENEGDLGEKSLELAEAARGQARQIAAL